MESVRETWTLRKVLDWCTGYFEKKGVDPARLGSELLLAHVLNCPRIRLYTDLHRPMSEAELATIKALVKRAIEHEPIQYLTGKAHFYNLEFEVNRDVLIPRPDTETLVDRALAHLKSLTIPEPRVLDLCTGSGCVAAAIAAHHKTSIVVGTDVSLPAIDVARRNIEKNKLADRVVLYAGDLYEALANLIDARPFDLIVSNPPYIASEKVQTLDANVRDFEPHLALDGGPDGLDPHRKILAGASDRLSPGGGLLMEIAFDQEEPAMWMLSQDPRFTEAKCFRDLSGHPRVISAKRM